MLKSFLLIVLIVYTNCESATEDPVNGGLNNFFNCSQSVQISYLESNESLTKYIDYRPGCSRQWVLTRPGFIDNEKDNNDDNQLTVIKTGALLIITHLDLDVAAGDYLLIAAGIPNGTYNPSVQVITGNIENESKTINIQSPITWIGLVNGPTIRSTIGLIFTWVPPELIFTDEPIPEELREASIDLCFEQVECSIIAQWRQLIRSNLTEKINNYLYNKDNQSLSDNNQIKPIDPQQLKIIRNESRIADEQTSQYKFCRVQIAVTSQNDIYWAHPQLTKSLLSQIWFANSSEQFITVQDEMIINYIQCEDESFDPLIAIISISIFVASLIASLGLWKWNHSYLQSIKRTIKQPATIRQQSDNPVIPSNENIKHNPIYESEGEDDDEIYIIGEKNN